MVSYAAEIEFLLKVCNLDPDTDVDSQLKKLPADFDWELLVNTAFQHGVTGMLCHSLIKARSSLIPDEMRYAAQQHISQQQQNNQNQADQLTRILSELNRAGIEAIPFKGMTLAMSCYGSLNLRTASDLDILVGKNDILRCIAILGELGYLHDRRLTPRQFREFLNYAGEDILFGPGVPVEPHLAFAPRTLAIRLDYPAIWRRTRQTTFNNQSILSLSAEDEFIMLCIHGCKSEWEKLKWVVDVAEFIRSHDSIDWPEIFARATSQGVARIVKIGILLAAELVEIEVPDLVEDWTKTDVRAISMVDKIAEEFFSENKTALDIWKPGYFHWEMRERLTDKLLYLVLTTTQPRIQHFADINIPDRLFLLYWPYRIFHDLIALPVWKITKMLRRQKKS